MSSTSLTLFVDTNLFLQCREIKSLPWAELGDFDAVQVIVCRPVQREIDNHKAGTNPRRSRKARAAVTLLREIISRGFEPLILRSDAPRVSLELRLGLKAHPATEGQSADDQLVGIARQYIVDNAGLEVRVLTDDTGVLASAGSTDTPYIMIPESWLLGAEEGTAEKELRAAQAEIAKLRNAEPIFAAVCAVGGEEVPKVDLIRQLWEPLSEAQVEELLDLARARFPMETNFESKLSRPAVEGAIGIYGMSFPIAPPDGRQIASIMLPMSGGKEP